MQVTFLRTKDDPLFNFKNGPFTLVFKEPCKHEIKELKTGKYLKVELENKNTEDLLLVRHFEVMFSSKYLYIPMKYVMSIKEGVSTEDF